MACSLSSSSSSSRKILQQQQQQLRLPSPPRLSSDDLDHLWFYGSPPSPSSRHWESAPCLLHESSSASPPLDLPNTQQPLFLPPPLKLSSAISMADQRALLLQVFDAFDENKDGLLSRGELLRYFHRLGLEASDDHVVSIFNKCGYRVDTEYVTPNEFLFLYDYFLCRTPPTTTDHMSEDDDHDVLLSDVFNIYDKNNDGFISPAELQDVLCSLGFEAMARDREACVQMICRFDRDGDGQLSFVEFKEMLLLHASSSSSTSA